jgi:hypothetical protein
MTRFVLSLAAFGLLAGCGIPGGLERPDPLWGSEEAIARECARDLNRGETRDPRCAEREQQAPQPQQ